MFPVVSKCVFNTIDIYGYDINEVNVSTEHVESTRLKIGNLLVNGPHNVDAVLNQIYGGDWKQPDQKKSAHGSNWCEGDDMREFKNLVSITVTN